MREDKGRRLNAISFEIEEMKKFTNEEANEKVEEERERNIERNYQFYSYLMNRVEGMTKKWVERVYIHLSEEMFNSEHLKSEIERCNLFEFMRIPLLNAINNYQE